MSGKTVTVIVPVYNVSKTLSRCIQSLCRQSYKNLHIILIDDGSNDGSEAICDEWAKKDSRVTVLHESNKGLSAARNAGINLCNTEFIAFVDSDDFVESDYISKMYSTMHNDNSDLVISGIFIDDEKGQPIIEQPTRLKSEILDGKSLLCTKDNWQYVVAWNKLYKASLWKSVKYPEGKIHEDEFVYHHILLQCQRVSIIPDRLYHYLKRPESITSKQYSLSNTDAVEAYIDRIKFCSTNGLSSALPKAFNGLVSTYKSAVQNLALGNHQVSERLHSLSENIQNIMRLIPHRTLTAKQSVNWFAYHFSPYNYEYIRKMLKKL